MNEAQKIVAVMADRLNEHVQLDIDDKPIEVVELRGREKLSEMFELNLLCRLEESWVPPAELIGKSARVVLHDGFGLYRPITGIVDRARRRVRDDGTIELQVRVRPAHQALCLSRDSRVFNDMTVVQIVDRVMEKTSAKHRWELTQSYQTRVYTAQYRESDWQFVSRLLEQEGIYYRFDHGQPEGTELVFADDSTSASAIMGEFPLEFSLDTGMLGNEELIHELSAEAHARATKFTVGSFNPDNPAVKVMATVGDGYHEMYDAPGGGPVESSECTRRANIRLECANSHKGGVSGNSTSIRLVPGEIVTVVGHPIYDDRYLVTEVSYEARQRRAFQGREEGGYECHFEAIRADTVFRAPEDTPLAKQAGVQTGRIVGPPGEEIHTDDKGRVRLQLHWDREGGWDDKAGKWMRVAQRGVASSMLYPRIGWNVVTFMEEGDVDAPTILSRLHDAEHPPTYPLPDNKTRTVFRTLTSPGGGSANEIRFEDLAGREEMFLNASKDMSMIVKDMYSVNVGNNQDRQVGQDQNLSVGTAMMTYVVNDQKVTIKGNEEIEIGDDQRKEVGGDETWEVGSDRTLECGSNSNITVKEDRQVTITGDVYEEATEGSISFQCHDAVVTIDSDHTRDTESLLSEDVGGIATVTVNKDVLEKMGRDRALECSDTLTETYGKNLKIKTGEHFLDGSDSLTQWTIGGAMTGSTKKMLVEAKDKIVIKCGGSSITLTQDSVKIHSPKYDMSGAEIVVKTNRVTHN